MPPFCLPVSMPTLALCHNIILIPYIYMPNMYLVYLIKIFLTEITHLQNLLP